MLVGNCNGNANQESSRSDLEEQIYQCLVFEV